MKMLPQLPDSKTIFTSFSDYNQELSLKMRNTELFVNFTKGAFLQVVANRWNQKQQATLCIVLTYHSKNTILFPKP